MIAQIRVTGGEEGTSAVEIDNYPDSCPICHNGIEAKFTGRAHVDLGKRLQLVFQCPRHQCQSFFISTYRQPRTSRLYVYSDSAPFKPVALEFSEHISKLSPRFCEIFNEALNAEHLDLKLIAGPGYRKALEFLVKDYLCKSKQADEEKIKNSQLGPCIDNFMDNEEIKQMAKRAAWLGNDETHYVRTWEDHDLEDLKRLIEVTVHWIEMEAITKKYLGDMPHGKKSGQTP
jgi:hypothetical protein